MTTPMIRTSLCLALGFLASSATAAEPADGSGRAIYQRVRGSIVAVGYTLDSEAAHLDRTFGGVVVRADGLVMVPLAAVDERIPDVQMKDFRIIVPELDGGTRELKAVFVARDPRTEVAFVKTVEPQNWPALQFDPIQMQIDDEVYSVGLMPAEAEYRPYLTRGRISGFMPGLVERGIVSDGGVATVGGAVFNAKGNAIGFVNAQSPFPLLLNVKDSMMAIINPPRFFTPATTFASSLRDLPSSDRPLALGWAGFADLAGLESEEAARLGLKEMQGVRVNAVLRNSPAEKAGLKRDDVVTQLNGQPLPRGANAAITAQILEHRLLCEKPGTEVVLTVVSTDAPAAPRQVRLTLTDRPLAANSAPRFWAPDIGLGVREFVPLDRDILNLNEDVKGLVVTLIKPRSPASAAKLTAADVICRVDGQTVSDINQFKSICDSARKAGDAKPLQLSVVRNGREMTVACELPR